jgi:transcriptional regulator with PAS, ATPase and Fis domain
MRALDLISCHVYTVQGSDPALRAVQLMKDYKVDEIPVLDGPQFLGLVYARDLLEMDLNQPVKTYTDQHCITITGDEPLASLPHVPNKLLPVVTDGIYLGCITLNRLTAALHELFLRVNRKNKQVAQRKGNDEFIARSPEMQRVLELVFHIASTDSTVLLLGESGVGKEMIARLLHDSSCRSATGAFITINCGAIPPHLLESEMFGYEQGAFTGALKGGKPGMFELADNGTLFLDEIAELPLNMQVKLLRVLQEREILRVGGTRPIKINPRVIAATNKNLHDMVKEGLFREDLYFRLNVIPIHVPPLRDRKEDIVPLLNYFLKALNQKYGYDKNFSHQLIERLLAYDFPGNVRELANLVERLVLTCREEVIEPFHLPPHVFSGQNYHESEHVEELEELRRLWSVSEPDEKEMLIERLDKRMILKLLKQYGSVRKTGKEIGVSHITILKKMKELGITLKNMGS